MLPLCSKPSSPRFSFRVEARILTMAHKALHDQATSSSTFIPKALLLTHSFPGERWRESPVNRDSKINPEVHPSSILISTKKERVVSPVWNRSADSEERLLYHFPVSEYLMCLNILKEDLGS